MSEQPGNPASTDDAALAGEPAAIAWAPPPMAEPAAETAPANRPEIAVAGAFAGGFVLAMLLKRLAH